MAFVVVYAANALYSSVLGNLLIRLGQAGLVQAKWTQVTVCDVPSDGTLRPMANGIGNFLRRH